MSAFSCPNCESEMYSAIRFWREGKQVEFWDMFVCGDCGRCTNPATKEEMPLDWQPYRKKVKQQGQVNLFGEIENIRSIVDPVPKLVEDHAGRSVCVYRIPADSPVGYATEVRKMAQELNLRGAGRHVPHWYKYRKIKRGK